MSAFIVKRALRVPPLRAAWARGGGGGAAVRHAARRALPRAAPTPLAAAVLSTVTPPLSRFFSCSTAVRSSSSSGGGGGVDQAPRFAPPTLRQYRILAVYSAIPMIAFGFMDNMIMIQAGDFIDNTIGVRFGLATLAAAACGQVVSDFSGVVFGGAIEAFFTNTLGVPIPNLTREQNKLSKVKLVRTASSALGVILGCLLGMTSLLFIDLKAAERSKREKELDTVFQSVMDAGKEFIGVSKCSLWLVDEERGVLWCKVFDMTVVAAEAAADGERKGSRVIEIPLGSGIAGAVAASGKAEIISDPYSDPRFNSDVDKLTGVRTNNILAAPVLTREGRPMGVIQMVNKDSGDNFTSEDAAAVKLLAAHVGLFIEYAMLD